MMLTENLVTKLVETIVDHLDIPKSLYEKAAERHRSLGKWFCRTESKVAGFKPNVSPQGSFRYGTVNRPVLATEKYDLDNVTILEMSKVTMTQKQLKEIYGAEIKEYAKAHSMLSPVEETNRCWRLNYSDEVPFHLDTLPCITEEKDVILAIISHGVPPQLAALAVAITDRRHPQYAQITKALLSSNPRGFAEWFEERTRPWALPRLRQLVEQRLYKSVEDVPAFEWKTPLQRSIQILKRHRDVMFRDNGDVGPISMIITNLAAHAYDGESDLYLALTNIVQGMPKYVNRARPRVPNPADPAEDYADKWAANPALEQNFWSWLTQVRVDIVKLAKLVENNRVFSEVLNVFQVELTPDELKQFEAPESRSKSVTVKTSPVLSIPAAPRPWGEHA